MSKTTYKDFLENGLNLLVDDLRKERTNYDTCPFYLKDILLKNKKRMGFYQITVKKLKGNVKKKKKAKILKKRHVNIALQKNIRKLSKQL